MKIKKMFWIITIILLLSTSMIFVKSKMTGKIVQEREIILGYCPSMEELAKKISETNSNVVISPKESTLHVLESLNNDEIDIALVGRIAKNSELEYSNKRVLGEGYTVISNNKQFVQKSELDNMKISTHLDRRVAEEYLPETEILYYENLEDSISMDDSDAALIDWKEYKDHMELLVVMDGNSKAIEFRIPVLYSKHHNLDKLKIDT